MPQVCELRIRQPLGQLAGIDERRHQGGMAFDPRRHSPEPPQRLLQAA